MWYREDHQELPPPPISWEYAKRKGIVVCLQILVRYPLGLRVFGNLSLSLIRKAAIGALCSRV